MYQVMCAVENLHSQPRPVVHRDIKPENILFIDGLLKLSDFGSANWADNTQSGTMCGTPEYLAPEMILNRGHCTKLDIWAFGVLLHEVLTGETPFAEMKIPVEASNSDIFKILSDHITEMKFQWPTQVSPEALDLLKNCLVKDPSQRFTARNCLSHPFFRQNG